MRAITARLITIRLNNKKTWEPGFNEPKLQSSHLNKGGGGEHQNCWPRGRPIDHREPTHTIRSRVGVSDTANLLLKTSPIKLDRCYGVAIWRVSVY